MDTPLKQGILLISDPFLKDENFSRTVVLLCEHNDEGSFGLILNRGRGFKMVDVLPDTKNQTHPLYIGGPVGLDTIHFIHQVPDKIGNSKEIAPGIYWGGSFKDANALLSSPTDIEKDIKFFLGYSGWGEHQLEFEMSEKTWITRTATRELVFMCQSQRIWKKSLMDLGGEYQYLAGAPLDPQLN